MSVAGPLRIGILLGSTRVPSRANNTGIAAWAHEHLQTLLDSKNETKGSKIEQFTPLTAPLPLGPVIEDYMPMALEGTVNPDGTITYPYHAEKDKEWSAIVQRWDGVIVVTPQYNWGIPGELKNAFDHILKEWKDKPFVVVNYGGHGGDKCAKAMEMLIHGIRANPLSVGKIMVSLPRENIAGPARSTGKDEFLQEWNDRLDEELVKLIEASQKHKGDREAEMAARLQK